MLHVAHPNCAACPNKYTCTFEIVGVVSFINSLENAFVYFPFLRLAPSLNHDNKQHKDNVLFVLSSYSAPSCNRLELYKSSNTSTRFYNVHGRAMTSGKILCLSTTLVFKCVYRVLA